MESSTITSYNAIRRNIYLLVIPIFIITNIYYWFVSPSINTALEIAIPPIVVLLIILWICFYKRIYFQLMEILIVAFTTVFQILRVHTMASEIAIGDINVYMFWSPVYYITIFMLLKRRQALYVSISVLVTTIAMTVNMIHDIRSQDIMLQFYMSTVIYIIILFYLNKAISAYIESDILIKMAYYDYLTNIGNRRSIDNWLEQALIKSQQQSTAFSIIYFDIDHFKKINDAHGHEVGDQILKEVVRVVKRQLTPAQYFGRWGGEEFIILLHETTLANATSFAEQLRHIIEAHDFESVEQVTASFGVATVEADEHEQAIIKRADDALYAAKQQGRNRVVSSNAF